MHTFWPFLSEGRCPLGQKPFDGFLLSLYVSAFGSGEDDCAFCPRLLPWLQLQESLEHCPVAFH